MTNRAHANINTLDYWNTRFGSGDWGEKGGYTQTRMFAEAQVSLLPIPADFDGTLCDFGCGAGDAIPVYRDTWRRARLSGVDFSASAIALGRERYGQLAEFICGDHTATPDADIIICSNVLEHLDDDLAIAAALIRRCERLFIIVPYREQPLIPEHVRRYDARSFSRFNVVSTRIFESAGWTEMTLSERWHRHRRNAMRLLRGQPLHTRRLQIAFEIRK